LLALVRDFIEQAIYINLNTVFIPALRNAMPQNTGLQEWIVERLLGGLVEDSGGLFALPDEFGFVLLLGHVLTERPGALECAMTRLLAPVVEASVW
jgi:hypothetical protein